MNYTDHYNSPIGKLTLETDGEFLTGLWFSEKLGVENKTLPIFKETKKWLDIYFKGKNPDFTPKIKLEGSAFRHSVWKILQEIPYGTTVTYKYIAQKVFKDKICAQAVGNAVGHNPISIIVPCHRVIGTNGSLTGYAGGLERKVKLLQLEGNKIKKVK